MRKSAVSVVLAAVTGAVAMALSSAAAAELVATIAGNDCPGVFGQGVANCKIPTQYDVNQSPVIIKFDGYSNEDFGKIEINTDLFPTIDGREFSFVFSMTDGSIGTWQYEQGPGDPDITFFVATGGPDFNLFSVAAGLNGADWFTPIDSNNGMPYGLSHLTFYDTGSPPTTVPEPGTLLLIGGALAALALRRRLRT